MAVCAPGAPGKDSEITYADDRIFNIFKVHREHTSYTNFLIFVESCQIFEQFFEQLMRLTVRRIYDLL